MLFDLFAVQRFGLDAPGPVSSTHGLPPALLSAVGPGVGYGRTKDQAPAYTRVLAWVEAQLGSGALVVGQKLPGERALAESFGISRASVRDALRVLVAMGLVRSGTGSGPHSGAVVVSEPSAALSWALRMHVATDALPMADVVSMRVLLETQAALMAATVDCGVRREQVMQRARGYLRQMDGLDVGDDARFHDLDSRFHVELTTLGGNAVLSTVMEALRHAVIGYVEQSVACIDDWFVLRGQLQVEHWAILAAFESGDCVEAARLLEGHIKGFHAAVLGAS